MRKKMFLYMILITSLLVGCNKYDLDGEKAIFIGNWAWVYSTGTYVDPGDGHHINFNVWPTDINKTFSMEFRDNGKYILRENDDIVHREKAKFVSWRLDEYYNKYYFCIEINKDYDLQGHIGNDTIILYQQNAPFYFPGLEEKDLNSLGYTSYFVKQ